MFPSLPCASYICSSLVQIVISALNFVQIPALDALEYVSVGIVKDVLKMKVLSVEDYDSLNKAKTDLEAMTSDVNACKADAEAARQEWREKLNMCEAKFSVSYTHLTLPTILRV